MLPIFGMILAGIVGYAIAQAKKSDSEQKQLPAPESPKLLSAPASTSTAATSPKTQHARKLGKSRDDLMLAAIQHANVTKDPRDYRAAAGLASKAGKPKTAKTLADLANARAKEIAIKAKKVEKIATVTGDPRALDVFAGLVEKIDQKALARRARATAHAIRTGQMGAIEVQGDEEIE